MHDRCWPHHEAFSPWKRCVVTMRDKLITPINNARTARDLSDQNRLRVLQELETELRLAGQVDRGMEPGDIFKITRASFNITIDSTSPTQVPMKFEYQSQALELTREAMLIFDFASPQEINLRRITEAIVNDLLNTTALRAKRSVTRVRRQVDDTGDLDVIEKSITQMEFETNCADHSGLIDFVNQLRQSLDAVRETSEEAKMRLRSSITDLRAKMEERNRANLNLDTLRDFFNVSMVDTPERESSDYRDYLQQLIKIASDSIRDIDTSSFAMWQTSTELLYNELESVLSYQCNGFADCIEAVVDITENWLPIYPLLLRECN